MHKATKGILKRLLTEQEAADYIGLSRSFLRQGRIYGHREGHIPPPPHLKLGPRAIRYDLRALDQWVEQFRSGLGAAPGDTKEFSPLPKRGRRSQQETLTSPPPLTSPRPSA